MYKVTLKNKSYYELEFVFDSMVDAAGFISTALRNTIELGLVAVVEEEITAKVTEKIPDEFEELE